MSEAKQAELTQRCQDWVNFSTFLAQCTAQGFFDRYENAYRYPSYDIPLGLSNEEEQLNVELRNARLLVAAQWIRYAGRGIYEDMAKSDEECPWWVGKWWSDWQYSLKEELEREDLDVGIRSALREALEESEAIQRNASLTTTDAEAKAKEAAGATSLQHLPSGIRC